MARSEKNMRLFRPLFFMVLALALLAAGCGHEPNLSPEEEVLVKGATFSFDKKAYPSPQNLFPEYKLVPGDVLDVLFQIRTWDRKEEFRVAVDHTVTIKFVHSPELNETQNVKPDGRITLPFIGEVLVAGRTVEEITAELKKRYRGYLRERIELYVTVPEYSVQIRELKKDLYTSSRGLSRLVTIRPDGYCTFPIAGDVFVATRTIPEVKAILDSRYENFLPGLHVDLFLEKHSGASIYVMGEVKNVGAYIMPKPINILQAVTLAGGLLPGANLKKVLVFRLCEQDRVATQVDLQATLVLGSNRTSFYLKPDDIIYVPRRRIFQMADVITEIGRVLMFRGWGFGFNQDLTDSSLF